MTATFTHTVQIYYEDTDHSGAVYHANYLKYFERAREHALGTAELVRMAREQGLGFVVYKASLVYKKPAAFGDTVEIRTAIQKSSDYRLEFRQDAYRESGGSSELLVEGQIELVCVDRDNQLVALPVSVTSRLTR